MRLVYARTTEGNFGDDLNQIFWDEVLPGWRGWDERTELVGIGTILEERRLTPGLRHLIIGSGIGYAPPPRIEGDSLFDIRAVRGPRTAAALGLPRSKGIVDPAVLVARWPRFKNIEPTGETLIIPHFGSVPQYPWSDIAIDLGLSFVNPSDSPEKVISRIAGAKRVIAESMHAAIIADAFRVPWTPIRINASFSILKWQDWGESLGINFDIVYFFRTARRIQDMVRSIGVDYRRRYNPDRQDNHANEGEYYNWSLKYKLLRLTVSKYLIKALRSPSYLSNETTLFMAMDRLEDVIETVRLDYGPR